MSCVHGCPGPSRPYPSGRLCDDHAPLPIPPTPDPALTLDGLRAAAGLPTHVTPGTALSYAAVDAKVIAKGSRRSNQADYVAAKATVEEQKRRRHP